MSDKEYGFLNVKLSKEDAQILDELVRQGRYLNRSDAIRAMIREAEVKLNPTALAEAST